MSIGSYLKSRRLELGLSLRKTADLIQTDAAYLSRVEAEKQSPSLTAISRLSEALRVPEQELLLMAGRLPPDIAEKASHDPRTSARALSAFRATLDSSLSSPLLVESGKRAIEVDFPFEQISLVAEAESWRKEIFRPIYHIHKWWAQRLGSVFRAILIGSLAPKGSNIAELMYQPVCFPGKVVFDPFMGSGTTVGEAVKLGCKAIGRDINPVAYRAVRTALQRLDRNSIQKEFLRLREDVAPQVEKFYVSRDSDGKDCRVLYYFWVKIARCAECGRSIDLFSSYVFAKHAYARRNPTVRVLCKYCENVFDTDFRRRNIECSHCSKKFDPHAGPVQGSKVICPHCEAIRPMVDLARRRSRPFDHRMYAKLVLRADGKKEYLPVTDFDQAVFAKACAVYRSTEPAVPRVPIQDGYNTRQIINYGYRSWHQLFNERQLLCLSILAKAVSKIEDENTREAFVMLFSSTLEFNNMFVSFKGEGTGAVRHMFSHHILKPERVPIEPNIWGTEKSSGAFSSLYHSRLLRALDYKDMPFELKVDGSTKKKTTTRVFGLSTELHSDPATCFEQLNKPGSAYLTCGSSGKTDLPDKSVDAIVTDPPFFDNVHYSELADFFFVWQRLYFGEIAQGYTTRHDEEVQDVDADSFARKLSAVFQECNRVLKEDGILVFTYHHSRRSGWRSVAFALHQSQFRIAAAHPVKSEMSVAQPKLQAKEPIDIDVIFVCRKRSTIRSELPAEIVLSNAYKNAKTQVARFNEAKKALSRNDVQVVFLSNLMMELSATEKEMETINALMETDHAGHFVESLFLDQQVSDSTEESPERVAVQLSLF